jgi:hypothetical protein
MDTLMGDGFSKSQEEKNEKESENNGEKGEGSDDKSESKNDDNVSAITEYKTEQIAGNFFFIFSLIFYLIHVIFL